MKLSKTITTVAFAVTVASAGALSVGAATNSAGTWQHGYTGATAYSNYYMPKQSHGSKVVNINNAKHDTANQIAGAYSHATIGDIIDPASFYYNDSTYDGAPYK